MCDRLLKELLGTDIESVNLGVPEKHGVGIREGSLDILNGQLRILGQEVPDIWIGGKLPHNPVRGHTCSTNNQILSRIPRQCVGITDSTFVADATLEAHR